MSRHDDPRFQDECADEDALRSGVRARNLRDIRNLYGTEEGPGREMLMEVVGRYMLDLLPDAAIAELAAMHRRRDERGH